MKFMPSVIYTLIIFFLISSCTLKTVKVKKETEEEAEFLISVLHNYNNAFNTVEGSALIIYRDGKRTVSFKSVILAKADLSSLRIDIEDFVFKKPLITVVKNGDTILAVNYLKKTYIQSSYSDIDFKKASGLDLPVELVMNFIIGRVPVAEGSYEGSISGTPRLYIQGDGYSETVFFTREILPQKIEYYLKDENYTVNFSKFSYKNETSFPQKITISSGNKNLEVSYTSLKINVKLSPGLFNIEDIPPVDFTPVN